MLRIRAAVVLFLAAASALAGEADVVGAKAMRAQDGTWRFDVTIRSNDKGWDYYADAFEVLAPDGRVLGTRVLLHPHEDEQPFTRELDAVRVPAGVDRVVIRARHKPKGYDGKTLELRLPR
jgi:hypothetical protein